MSTKALKTQLLAAVAMVLVASVALGSSTYAWFASNNKVTAASMEVKATTGPNLYIAKGANVALDGLTATTVTDLGVSNTAISPAELSDDDGTVTVKNVATYDVAPTVSTSGSAATYTDIGTLTTAEAKDESGQDLDNYSAYGFVTIARKQTNKGTYTLTPKCTINFGEASKLNKCIRAGLIINGALYEPSGANIEAGKAEFTFANVENLSDNTADSACLVIWFEGEDENCTSNNAVKVSTNTATWEFTAA